MIQVSAKVDTKNFENAFGQWLKVTSQAPSNLTNSAGYGSALSAVTKTKRASKEKINKLLGTIETTQVLTAKGRLKKVKVVRSTMHKTQPVPIAALIVNWKQAQQGKPALTGPAMSVAIKKEINKRIKSINFIRSSWLPAVNLLGAIVKGRKESKGEVAKGMRLNKKLGSAKGAKPNSWKAHTAIWSDLRGDKHGVSPTAKAVLEVGMQDALNDWSERKLAYLAERDAKRAAEQYNRK